MNIQARLFVSTQDEFRHAHMIWKKANDSFHDRFQAIIMTGRIQDLDNLAQDLAEKFDNFIQCSKAFVAGR